VITPDNVGETQSAIQPPCTVGLAVGFRCREQHIGLAAVGQQSAGERFTQAAGLGAAFDGLIEGNGSAQKVLEAATTGGENNLTGLVTQSTLAAVLARMMDRADGPAKEKLASLLAEAMALGLGDPS
jgi:hypothetical protein